MSPPVASERNSYVHSIPPASRLIPGFALGVSGATRRKYASARLNPQHWVEESQAVSVPTERLWNLILPSSAEKSQYRLMVQVAADFLLSLACMQAVTASLQRSGIVQADTSRIELIVLYAVLLTLFAYSEGLYHSDTPPDLEAVIVGKALAWTTIFAAVTLYRFSAMVSQSVLAGAPFLYFGLIGWRSWKHRRGVSASNRRNVLIVGASERGRRLAQQIVCRDDRRDVCGFIDDEEPLGGDVLGRTEDLARIARAEFADEVIVASTMGDATRRLIREAQKNRLDVRIMPECAGFQPALSIDRCGDSALVTLHEEAVPGASLHLKRMTDVLISVLILLASSPLLFLIAALIKMDSAGPVFYRAERAGKKGRPFFCYKFRTMIANADHHKDRLRSQNEREGATFKINDDPRITRLGRFLRRYSLDELPQLFNILKGDMSLVGPRPHPLDDCSRYRLADLRRLDVVPGLTGLWQVVARGDPSFEKNMALDLDYIEHWNLWLDLKILCRTVWVVLQGTGA